MESKNSPDAETQSLLAAHLAKPFLLPGQSGQPLSLRSLPDGGLVVIASDGRKLWFTALEVCRARQALNQPAVKKAALSANTPTLHEPDPRKPVISSHLTAKSRDGMSEVLVLPQELKYLEERHHDPTRNHPKPRPTNPG
jgi:hypothetical protein